MKLGFFTDSHYSSYPKNSKSLSKIEAALKYFKKEKCDLVVFLGDLIDKEDTHHKEIENLKQVSSLLKESGLSVKVIIGNHDTFSFSKDEFYAILGEEFYPENSISKDKNFVFLDTCNTSDGKDYYPGFCDWSNIYVPRETELVQILADLPQNPTYVFMHHGIDPAVVPHHRPLNHEAIRKVLESSQKVTTVFQGHEHRYLSSVVNGILYITYPSVLEEESAFYTVDL